jgi:hypothetical protein
VGIDFSPRNTGRNRDKMIRVYIFFPAGGKSDASDQSTRSETAQFVNDDNDLQNEEAADRSGPTNNSQSAGSHDFNELEESPDWIIEP